MTRVTRPDVSSRQWGWMFSAWLIAVASTLGSLFFSEVMNLPPCVLCWYQRIFMFPLAVIFSMALFPFDLGHVKYSLALAVGGWLVTLYPLSSSAVRGSDRIAANIEQDRADGLALNVKATPNFIVNGHPLRDFGVEQLKALVRREVDKVYKQ